jgi:thymidylate kinase
MVSSGSSNTGNTGSNDGYDDSRYKHFENSSRQNNNFATAATLLRIARNELRIDLISDDDNDTGNDNGSGEQIVEDFYNLLQKVEDHIQDTNNGTGNGTHTRTNDKFIVEIEGLDGSGKTTLCQSLTREMNTFLQSNSNTNNSNTDNNKMIKKAIATKTPSACLKKIRPLWDHRGGILARAFYMVSNYVLQYQIYHELPEDVHIVFIDRWYASTVAYTVAYNGDGDTNGDEKNKEIDIASLPNHLFSWPHDLQLQPNLLLILNIDPTTRQTRVNHRKVSGGGASQFNPWDDRLEEDLLLGTRILEAFSRIHFPNTSATVAGVNANLSMEDVLHEAMEVVIPVYQKFSSPHLYFRDEPLEWWKYESSVLGLCHGGSGSRSGKRCHHALWNLQVAYQHDGDGNGNGDVTTDCGSIAPPVLKTVGLDSITSNCIYYWTSSSSIANMEMERNKEKSASSSVSSFLKMASCLWMAGDYPKEQQWRAEGFITKVTESERELLDYGPPPPSLVAHVTASDNVSGSVGKGMDTDTSISIGAVNSSSSYRPTRPENYDKHVEKARKEAVNANGGAGSSSSSSSVCLVRFVPIRVELLKGGPSSRIGGYPERWEWVREKGNSGQHQYQHQHQTEEIQKHWIMKSILPFSAPISTCGPTMFKQYGITLALTGCHTSGKTTIGKALAKILGWEFEPELGEILRQKDALQPGGHMYGDGSENGSKNESRNTNASGSSDQDEKNKNAWDDLIFEEEVRRDLNAVSKNEQSSASSSYCRVVETWHVGNAKWYALRQGKVIGDGDDNSDVDVERYKTAITNHQATSIVLLVNLNIPSSSIMMDRRKAGDDKEEEDGTVTASARNRLPLKDEEKECEELYQALQFQSGGSSDPIVASCTCNVPMIQIDNGDHGPEAIERTLKSILSFVQLHSHRRLVPV